MRNVSQGCTSTADIKAFIVPSIIGIGKIGLIFRNGLIHINGVCWVLAIGFWLLQRLMCESFLSTQKGINTLQPYEFENLLWDL